MFKRLKRILCLFRGHHRVIECDTVARTYHGKCLVCSKMMSSGSLPTPMTWSSITDNSDLDEILESLAKKKSEDDIVVEMLTDWEKADDNES